MNKTPARILNEKTGFLGLTIFDITALGYALILSHEILKFLNLELLSFPLLGLAAFVLLGIRLKYRSKIIRDFVSYLFIKKIYFKKGLHL